jgi:hypothetical protein
MAASRANADGFELRIELAARHHAEQAAVDRGGTFRMLQRLFREALRFPEQARADGLDPDAGGLPVVARQLLVDGYQDVPQRARFGASKAILVQVPEDLDIDLADRCRLRRDPFQYPLRRPCRGRRPGAGSAH